MNRLDRPEVPPDPIVPSRGTPCGFNQRGNVRPCRDRHLTARCIGNPLRYVQAWLPLVVQQRVQVRTRDSEQASPFRIRASRVGGDVLCKLFHAPFVAMCDTVVKGA